MFISDCEFIFLCCMSISCQANCAQATVNFNWRAFAFPSHWVESLLMVSQVCFLSHGGWLCWKLLPLLLIIESDMIFSSSILYKVFVKIKYNEYGSSLFFEGDTESSAAKPELEGGCYLTDFPLSLEFLQQYYHHYNSLSSNINVVFRYPKLFPCLFWESTVSAFWSHVDQK